MPLITSLRVCVRVDHELIRSDSRRNAGVEVLAYSESPDEIMHFIETVAARDVFGRMMNPETDADPFFDMEDDDGEQMPDPPEGRFLVWDNDIEEDDSLVDRPTSVEASVSLYASKAEDPDRKLLRSYKMCLAHPTLESFRAERTAGDEMLEQQMMTVPK
jgi:hypothetical protein